HASEVWRTPRGGGFEEENGVESICSAKHFKIIISKLASFQSWRTKDLQFMAELAVKPAATTPRVGKLGDPCVMVIFGAAGDLTARLLLPALYNLARANLLSK